VRNDNTAFFNDVQRGYRQTAAFTSLDFDIIPKVLTVTAGTRYYRFVNDEKGAVVGSFTCYEAGPGPCYGSATNIDGENLHTTYQGAKSRGNVTWHFLPDALAYYTWSQAFARVLSTATTAATSRTLRDQAILFSAVIRLRQSHQQRNRLENRILRPPPAVERRGLPRGLEQRTGRLLRSGVLGNVGFGTNGPDYRIHGVETSFVAVLAEGLTAQGGAAWNTSKQTNSPFLVANNPALLANPATKSVYGQPLYSVDNPFGPIGGPSANSPPLQFNARLRYQWRMSAYDSFVQAG